MATIMAMLVVSCLLPYATGDILGYPRRLDTAVAKVSFDMPAGAPVEFLAFSRELNAQMGRVSFDVPAAAPVALIASSRELNVAVEPVSFEIPSATPVTFSAPTVQRQVTAHQRVSDRPSPVPAAFYGLPRRLEANVDRIGFDTPALAPMAFVRFCMQYPQDCKVRRMAFRPRPVALTKLRSAELTKVNRDVNRAIRPQENLNGVMAEEWLVAPREGDCNDYAVTKRHKLLELGWPSRSLLLAEVVVASGEHHLVLVVRTREEDLVLDNLNWNVRPVSQIHYQWVRAQQAGNPKFWSSINVTRAARVAMNTR
jgi:predicted transglutaminase-like cysteine proteinase